MRERTSKSTNFLRHVSRFLQSQCHAQACTPLSYIAAVFVVGFVITTQFSSPTETKLPTLTPEPPAETNPIACAGCYDVHSLLFNLTKSDPDTLFLRVLPPGDPLGVVDVYMSIHGIQDNIPCARQSSRTLSVHCTPLLREVAPRLIFEISTVVLHLRAFHKNSTLLAGLVFPIDVRYGTILRVGLPPIDIPHPWYYCERWWSKSIEMHWQNACAGKNNSFKNSTCACRHKGSPLVPWCKKTSELRQSVRRLPGQVGDPDEMQAYFLRDCSAQSVLRQVFKMDVILPHMERVDKLLWRGSNQLYEPARRVREGDQPRPIRRARSLSKRELFVRAMDGSVSGTINQDVDAKITGWERGRRLRDVYHLTDVPLTMTQQSLYKYHVAIDLHDKDNILAALASSEVALVVSGSDVSATDLDQLWPGVSFLDHEEYISALQYGDLHVVHKYLNSGEVSQKIAAMGSQAMNEVSVFSLYSGFWIHYLTQMDLRFWDSARSENSTVWERRIDRMVRFWPNAPQEDPLAFVHLSPSTGPQVFCPSNLSTPCLKLCPMPTT